MNAVSTGPRYQVFLAGVAATLTMMVAARACGSSVMRQLQRLAATAVAPRGSTVGPVIGVANQLVSGGVIALLYGGALGGRPVSSSWRAGLALGLVHGVGAGLLLGATPALHPRVPDELPAPGAFMRHRGRRAPIGLVALHGLYGALVGAAVGVANRRHSGDMPS